MNKVFLSLLAFFMFSCSNSDDTIVEEGLEPIEEPTEPKVYKLKEKTFDYDSEYYLVEGKMSYEYGTHGFISQIKENLVFISGGTFDYTADYYYTNNLLDSIVNNNIYSGGEASRAITILNHDARGFITDDVRYYNGNISETNEYFYSGNQLEYITRRTRGTDGNLGTPTTEYLIYENGVLVGYESAFPTTRTFDDKNNPEINLYSPDYKRIAKNLFIHNTLTQSSTSSSVKRKYEYEYNSDDFPVKSLSYEDDKFVFETNYIYY